MHRRRGNVLACALVVALAACSGSSGGQSTNDSTGSNSPGDGRSGGLVSVDEDSTGRIALGNAHTCAIRADDVITCWGDNQYQQFPRPAGTPQYSTTPVQVAALGGGRTAVRITAGSSHTCVVASDGTVWCWGNNGSGQLGIGTWANTVTPTQVTLSTTARVVAAGGQTTCALLTDNSVWCWGLNDANQLGIGSDTTSKSTPVKADFPAGTPVTTLTVGAEHVCAGASTGALWCWGASGEGRLGGTYFSNLNRPTATQMFSPAVSSASAGGAHTCVAVGGAAKCFGDNGQGQLGVSLGGGALFTASPQQVTGSGVVGVAAGEAHTCVAQATSVACAGRGFTGVQTIAGLSGTVVDVAAGAGHSCAVLATGDVRCWGANNRGQLGTGDTSDRTTAGAVGSLSVVPTTTTTSSSTTTTTVPAGTSTTSASEASSTTIAGATETTTTTTTVVSTTTGLLVKKGRTIRAITVVKAVNMTVPPKGQGTMRLSIVAGTKYCAFKGTSIKGVRKGRCTIRVVSVPKNGKVTAKRISIRVV